MAHPDILAAIEPLLGNDCHVIANTAWRNPPTFGGGPWHCDAGPHVPRPAGVPWDDRIPYPDLRHRRPPLPVGLPAVLRSDGGRARAAIAPDGWPPRTGCSTPTSTTTGGAPSSSRPWRATSRSFVSDVWHRGTPAGPDGRGRFFLQCHYGRRDIAQRLRTTDQANQVSPAAASRAATPRERALIGLHEPFFYDG